MAEKLTEQHKQEHLIGLMKGCDTAMLVTRASSGELRSRPLAVAATRDDGTVVFATNIDSPKVQEVSVEPNVNVVMQDGRTYVSLTGRARVERDRAEIERVWSEPMKVWFPEGKDDPSLCLLIVEPDEAEYWDNAGAEGLRYLFQAARAYVTGTRPDERSIDDAQNARLSL